MAITTAKDIEIFAIRFRSILNIEGVLVWIRDFLLLRRTLSYNDYTNHHVCLVDNYFVVVFVRFVVFFTEFSGFFFGAND